MPWKHRDTCKNIRTLRSIISYVGEVSWIFDIGYSILENFLSPAPHERSLSVMRYGLTNDTVF